MVSLSHAQITIKGDAQITISGDASVHSTERTQPKIYITKGTLVCNFPQNSHLYSTNLEDKIAENKPKKKTTKIISNKTVPEKKQPKKELIETIKQGSSSNILLSTSKTLCSVTAPNRTQLQKHAIIETLQLLQYFAILIKKTNTQYNSQLSVNTITNTKKIRPPPFYS